MLLDYEGWTWLTNSSKWHYFRGERRSLCGKFLHMGSMNGLEQGNDDSPDNCAACRRKLQQIRQGRQDATARPGDSAAQVPDGGR